MVGIQGGHSRRLCALESGVKEKAGPAGKVKRGDFAVGGSAKQED